MQTVIETKGLCKVYGRQFAVDHLDLTVPEGCVYGFIGPNGAGKSTTMKMLLGLIHPSAGQVTLLGQPMNAQNRLALLQKTGSLIESPAGYGHLTGQENLEIVADLKGVPRKDIARVLDIVHLTGDKYRKVREYSLGMRQRLGIAQALLGNPRVIILDEPTVGLDPLQIIEIRDLIRELGKTHTVIFSSHILSEVQAICDEILMIAKGRLAAFDTPENLEKELLARNELRLTTDAAPGELRALLAGVEAADTLTVESEPPPLHGRQRAHQGGGYLRAVPRGLSGVCRQRPCPFGAVAQKGHAGGCLHRRRGGLQHGHRRLFRLLPRQQSRQTRPHRSAAV